MRWTLSLSLALLACSTPAPRDTAPVADAPADLTRDTTPDVTPDSPQDTQDQGPQDQTSAPGPLAHVTGVTVSGQTLSVTIASQETGCDQYANWWEVTSEDGTRLIYRRILGHSHVDEQPFTRSGGPVEAGPQEQLVVRAHMAPGGYGGRAWRGTLGSGFSEATLAGGVRPGFGAGGAAAVGVRVLRHRSTSPRSRSCHNFDRCGGGGYVIFEYQPARVGHTRTRKGGHRCC